MRRDRGGGDRTERAKKSTLILQFCTKVLCTRALYAALNRRVSSFRAGGTGAEALWAAGARGGRRRRRRPWSPAGLARRWCRCGGRQPPGTTTPCCARSFQSCRRQSRQRRASTSRRRHWHRRWRPTAALSPAVAAVTMPLPALRSTGRSHHDLKIEIWLYNSGILNLLVKIWFWEK